jgi:succinylglutamate desuccinylase
VSIDQSRIQHEIESFRSWFSSRTIPGRTISEPMEDVFVISPTNQPTSIERSIDLTLLALTHGHEVGGIRILNQTLRMFDLGWSPGPLTIAFALGNVPAALKGRRYLERDLNRAFGNAENDIFEDQRARILEKLFLKTRFLVDYHQTESVTLEPFYISRFDCESFSRFRTALPDTCAVTYFGRNLTPGSLTTVNYHLLHGGMGFGVETGPLGFFEYQTEYGVLLAIKIALGLAHEKITRPLSKSDFEKTYTFDRTIVTKTGTFMPKPNLGNFQELDAGELIGELDGNKLFTENKTRLVFLKQGSGESLVPGSEVFRHIRPLTDSEISEHLAVANGGLL